MPTLDLKALADDPKPVSVGFLAKVLGPFSAALADSIGALRKDANKHSEKLDSAERRLSRHADHLARLESRLQSLEHKDGK